MPAFTFEKIGPSAHATPSASVKKSRSAASAKSRSVIRQMIDSMMTSRTRRDETKATALSRERTDKR